MNNEELKEALMNERPVIVKNPLLGDIEYIRVSAIVYRKDKKGGIRVSAEVVDKCLHSITVADPKNITYKEG